jgi:hypothetical protein
MSFSRPKIFALPTFVRSMNEHRNKSARTGRILKHCQLVRSACIFEKQVGTYRESIFSRTFLVSFSSCSPTPNPASTSLLRFSYISSLPIFSVVILTQWIKNETGFAEYVAKKENWGTRRLFSQLGFNVFKHVGAAILSTTGPAVCSPRGAQMTGA